MNYIKTVGFGIDFVNLFTLSHIYPKAIQLGQ